MEMRVQRIHEVTYEELDTFLEYLKLIARRADITISVEVKQEEEVSTTLNVNPKSSKGRKITLHYGEVYLLARAINQPDTILCDDESVFYLNVLLSGICGVNLDVDRTIEHLYFMFESGTLSATDFKKPGRLPPKNSKDRAVCRILSSFMNKLAEAYNGL